MFKRIIRWTVRKIVKEIFEELKEYAEGNNTKNGK